MAEPEFDARGVRIERWPRSLTKAGQVLIQDGRLALLTSYGRVIDSAPLRAVRAARPWFAGRGSTVATVNGIRYRLTMGQRDHRPDASALAVRFMEAVSRASHKNT
ncbi:MULTISPECIES: hypothetical protein [unclassified Streptomyces]|uniref:hypothetical protein n=1 Tax=unclassified Streptomyces TaxID=2593676 RepID=UPI00081ECD97|nr:MULTISPECIES: hypothetical protein [unclassified Streptomyces]MYZ35611.1 hypothetical protein [Streptomyces sp. SID4917]SCF76900.1 hypothetical protein GA0115259_102305 [Streptomyces sp. MnatMP-M17]